MHNVKNQNGTAFNGKEFKGISVLFLIKLIVFFGFEVE